MFRRRSSSLIWLGDKLGFRDREKGGNAVISDCNSAFFPYLTPLLRCQQLRLRRSIHSLIRVLLEDIDYRECTRLPVQVLAMRGSKGSKNMFFLKFRSCPDGISEKRISIRIRFKPFLIGPHHFLVTWEKFVSHRGCWSDLHWPKAELHN